MPASSRLTPTRGWLVVLGPLLAAFFWAPLAFGGTTPFTLRVFDELLTLSFALWLGLLLYEHRPPRLALPAALCLLFLIGLGILHLVNPRSVLDPTFGDLEPVAQAFPSLPGSVDARSTAEVLRHFVALLLGGLVLHDALARTKLRWILFRTIALAGLAVALVGIYQKATMAEAMLWADPENSGNVFFGAFRYHANAASFLNLSWPAALAVFLRSRLLRPVGLTTSLDLCVLFFVLAAVLVNSSKAGQLIGLGGALLMAWRYRGQLRAPHLSRPVKLVLAVLLLGVFAVVLLPGYVGSLAKWNELTSTGASLEGRLLAYGACLKVLPDSGFFGTGAGTFRHVFPFYTIELGDRITGFWYHAHQDWLQGMIEWGYAGFAAWAVLFGGAIARLWKRAREAAALGQPALTATLSLLALVLVLGHALVDFPLQIPAIQWLVVFYLAVGWRISPPAPGHKKTPGEAG